jgi:tRNA threonylcarbamoyladenosine biosynthesis protein TsaB
LAIILNIESATSLCSVSLAINGNLTGIAETLEDRSHARLLSVFIQQVIAEAGISVNEIDAFAVGKGPGSYTGLRIGVSTVKGLCYGSGKPLIAIGTLEILCRQYINTNKMPEENFLICPMIDARRMEVYHALFDQNGKALTEVSAKIIDRSSFDNVLENSKVVFIGSGMSKCRNILEHPHAVFADDIHPSSAALAGLSWEAFRDGRFEDTAYFEPFYLKDFVTTVPKRKLTV